MTPELAAGWDLVDAGDVPGAMRELRLNAATVTPTLIAPLVERVARLADLDDLATAAAALAAATGRRGRRGRRAASAEDLYTYGYACIERGASFLAVPALQEALQLAPDSRVVLLELLAALDRETRHAEALKLLEGRGPALPHWPERYLVIHHALMSGRLATARAGATALPAPAGEDAHWRPALERLHRMLNRAAAADGASALDRDDLRGWHFVLTGGILTTLSPYGFASGMTGRYAFMQDTAGLCLLGLRRLRLVLDAAGCAPSSVSLLPDRSSHILGLAAAEVLGLPVEAHQPGRPGTVVVAYDLREVDGEILRVLAARAPGEVVYEQATCWTEPSAVASDVSTLLLQTGTAPWGPRMRLGEDRSVEHLPEDERLPEAVATDLLDSDPDPDGGDGETPPDPDQGLRAFVAAPALGGWRDHVSRPVRLVPIPSNQFM